MSERKQCSRCGTPTPVIDNIKDTETYYGFQVITERSTTVRKSVRLIIWTLFGRDSKRVKEGRSPSLTADDEVPLCDDCGHLLVGRFMQGRSVPAIEGKETW